MGTSQTRGKRGPSKCNSQRKNTHEAFLHFVHFSNALVFEVRTTFVLMDVVLNVNNVSESDDFSD